MRRLIAVLAASTLFAGLSAPLARARPPGLGYREAWQAVMRANLVIDMSEEYGYDYKVRMRDEADAFPDGLDLNYWHAEWPRTHRERRDVVRFSLLVGGGGDCAADIVLGVRELNDREVRAEHRRYHVRVFYASQSEYGCNG
jgi:hypothetical protein